MRWLLLTVPLLPLLWLLLSPRRQGKAAQQWYARLDRRLADLLAALERVGSYAEMAVLRRRLEELVRVMGAFRKGALRRALAAYTHANDNPFVRLTVEESETFEQQCARLEAETTLDEATTRATELALAIQASIQEDVSFILPLLEIGLSGRELEALLSNLPELPDGSLKFQSTTKEASPCCVET